MADPKIVEAIAFFEQMLQTMPKDRTALETLAVAYEQTGQAEKRRDILVRLADVLLLEQDFVKARAIAEALKAFPDHMGAKLAIERVNMLAPAAEPVAPVPPVVPVPSSQPIPSAAAMPEVAAAPLVPDAASVPLAPDNDVPMITHNVSSSEMELVWKWIDSETLPKEIGMDILHVLTDRPVSDLPVLVSALAVLDEQHPERTDPIMEIMEKESGAPAIPLELFDINPEAVKLLSTTYIQVAGVLPFCLMGGEALVALLNPLNETLKDEIIKRTNRPCHFFLVHPKDFAAALKKANIVSAVA